MSQQGGQTHTTCCAQQCCDMLCWHVAIATCQHNISQHCWAQRVVCVWLPCCDVLRHPTCRKRTKRVAKRTQHCCDMLSWHVAIVWSGLKAPAKRSQHANATYRNIVGRNMLCSFGHHVAMCCDMLGVVGSTWWLKMFKFAAKATCQLNISQHVANALFSNLNQQHPTCRNMVAKRTQRVAPNSVAICCVGMLRSFGRGLTSRRCLCQGLILL